MSQAGVANSHTSLCPIMAAYAFFLAVAPLAAVADTLYKCKDANEHLQYQATPCAQAKEVSHKPLATAMTPVDTPASAVSTSSAESVNMGKNSKSQR